MLVTACDDLDLRLFSLPDLQFKKTVAREPFGIRHMALHSSGKRVAIATDEAVVLVMDLTEGPDSTNVVRLTGHSRPVAALSFHPSAPILVSSSVDGSVKVWTKGLKEWKCIHTSEILMGNPDSINSQSFATSWHPSGSHFALCAFNGDIKIVKSDSWRTAFTLTHLEEIASVQFSPNGVYLMCIGVNRLICIWNLEESRTKPVIKYFTFLNHSVKHIEKICQVKWSPTANDIIVSDALGLIYLWGSVLPKDQPHPVTSKPRYSLDDPDEETLFGLNEDDEFIEVRNPSSKHMDIEASEDIEDSGSLAADLDNQEGLDDDFIVLLNLNARSMMMALAIQLI